MEWQAAQEMAASRLKARWLIRYFDIWCAGKNPFQAESFKLICLYRNQAPHKITVTTRAFKA